MDKNISILIYEKENHLNSILYQQLSELNSDQLTQTVSIYDKDVEDFSHADSTLININDQIHIGI